MAALKSLQACHRTQTSKGQAMQDLEGLQRPGTAHKRDRQRPDGKHRQESSCVDQPDMTTACQYTRTPLTKAKQSSKSCAC